MPDYKKDLKIKKYDLLNELIRQPQKYMDWAERSVKAGIERDEARNKLDITKAEVEADIRNEPTEFGLDENPKEGGIKAAIIRNKKVKRAQKDYFIALERANILSKAEVAFQQRKSMLTSLVQLDTRLHFAEPYVPKEIREEVNGIERDRIKSGLKKSRKIRRR